MSKAILELPKMPESCSKCLLQTISTEKQIRYCTVNRKMILNEIEERNKFFDELENKLIESGEKK